MDCTEHRSTHTADGKCWYVDQLWILARDLPVTSRAVQSFRELQECCWEQSMGLADFAAHVRRVEQADPAYPIIISAEGWLMDGAHRLVKAMLRGETHVPVQQFQVTPPPDFEDPEPEELIEGFPPP